MRKLAAILLSFAFAATVFAGTATERYIVATRGSVAVTRAGAMIRDVDGTAQPVPRDIMAFRSVNGFAADLTPEEVSKLRRSSDVRYVEPVQERHALDIGGRTANDSPNPFAQTVPFGIDLVRAREVWPVTRGEGINVVVIDTGIDYYHSELAGVYAGGYNTYDKSTKPLDDNGHGTHVSGTIAAADNDAGVVGVAPRVKLWAVKVLNASGSGTTDKIIAALDWVIEKKNTLGGDWVVNLSLGSSNPSPIEREAFGRAVDAGLLICAASGNESTAAAPAAVGYPAAYRGVLAIGAVDKNRAIASFSNQGVELGVVAPGVAVMSTVRVGTGSIAGVQSNAGNFSASEIAYSKRGTVTGQFVNCGIGKPEQFPASVAGKIAVIKRGELTFNAKTHNALNAGAIAVIIYNHDSSALSWTLLNDADPGAASFDWPVTIAMSKADGEALLALGSGQITVTDRADDYDTLSGTSMATPHAAGVAALVWSAAPAIPATDVKLAMTQTAGDLGTPGFDSIYGNGLLDALNAAKSVAPAKFGNGGTPAPAPPGHKTRSVRRH